MRNRVGSACSHSRLQAGIRKFSKCRLLNRGELQLHCQRTRYLVGKKDAQVCAWRQVDLGLEFRGSWRFALEWQPPRPFDRQVHVRGTGRPLPSAPVESISLGLLLEEVAVWPVSHGLESCARHGIRSEAAGLPGRKISTRQPVRWRASSLCAWPQMLK